MYLHPREKMSAVKQSFAYTQNGPSPHTIEHTVNQIYRVNQNKMPNTKTLKH